MNLLKHLIIQIESTEDVTDAYVESMQKTDPHFTAEENVFKVKLLSECYGRLEQREMIWRESEFIHKRCYIALGSPYGTSISKGHECRKCGKTIFGRYNYCPDCAKRLGFLKEGY